MSRTKIPSGTQTDVLVQSRRRCCLCYGLNRDTGIKEGQIAHLDKKNSNNELDNLAFLCFEHHNSYDSIPSQSKGIQPSEVKSYRQQLMTALGSAFEQQTHFGTITIPRSDPYAGTYVRLGNDDSPAELSLTPLPDTIDENLRYYVHGMAYNGMSRSQGPNMGELGFAGIMYDKDELDEILITFSDRRALTSLRWLDQDVLVVQDQDTGGRYGIGVTFSGTYKRKR